MTSEEMQRLSPNHPTFYRRQTGDNVLAKTFRPKPPLPTSSARARDHGPSIWIGVCILLAACIMVTVASVIWTQVTHRQNACASWVQAQQRFHASLPTDSAWELQANATLERAWLQQYPPPAGCK